MMVRRRLRRLDENAATEFVHDQYTAPLTWWWATLVGLVALVFGLVKGDGIPTILGTVLMVVGVGLSVATRRADKRAESRRRRGVEADADARRARRHSK